MSGGELGAGAVRAKSVAQIRQEWEAIEAKRPGGDFPGLSKIASQAQELGCPDGERDLLDIIAGLRKGLRSYHAEMGILLAECAGLRAQAEAVDREWKACVSLWRELGHPMLIVAASEVQDRMAAIAQASAEGQGAPGGAG